MGTGPTQTSRGRRWPRRLAATLTASAALALAACGGGGEPGEQVEIGGGLDPTQADAALQLAAEASFPLTDTTTDRVTPDGITLGSTARYFEPLRVDGAEWGPPPFDGPTGPTALEARGLIGGVVPLPEPPPGLDVDGDVSLVLVSAYDHGAAVTLELADGAQGDLSVAAQDVQPADGWTNLGLLVPTTGEPVAATVNTEARDGSTTYTDVEVPPAQDVQLAVLTPSWEFDPTPVGDQCVPPETTAPPQNVPPMPEPFGGPVDKPELPEPGEQPDDPASATAAVLASIRIVYDVDDLHRDDRVDFLEDPERAEPILEEIEALQVVEPYQRNLDPVFDSVAFTSPTQARVLYRVGPGYSWEVGRVLLEDGRWRVALGTFCRDLSDALYDCPGVEQDPGPGPLG